MTSKRFLSWKERHGSRSGFVVRSSNTQQRQEEVRARPKSVVRVAFKGVSQVSGNQGSRGELSGPLHFGEMGDSPGSKGWDLNQARLSFVYVS